ncbi:MAG: DUF2256 and DUF3253 domain-containing protein [Acidobacteriota bacterium]
MSAVTPEPKTCAACGRTMTWRKSWAKNWERMRYCSAGCRRQRGTARLDRDLKNAILSLLDQRASGTTICPPEAARLVREDGWREIMERTRSAARRLTSRGAIEIVQVGQRVDPSKARGPIRLRRVDSGSS